VTRALDDLLRIIFADPKIAQASLNAPVTMLGGRTPAGLIEAGRVDEVMAVLAGLASGAHA
jgi:Protein of unknown function (DUF2384)